MRVILLPFTVVLVLLIACQKVQETCILPPECNGSDNVWGPECQELPQATPDMSSTCKTQIFYAEEIRQDLQNKMNISGKLVALDAFNIGLTLGKERIIHMGVFNPKSDTKCFQTVFKCQDALKDGNKCSINTQGILTDSIKVGGGNPASDAILGIYGGNSSEQWFEVPSQMNIGGRKFGMYQISMKAESATKDTYAIQVALYENQNDCANINPLEWTSVATEDFYIKFS